MIVKALAVSTPIPEFGPLLASGIVWATFSWRLILFVELSYLRPKALVAAGPVGPVGPWGPWGPVIPCSPCWPWGPGSPFGPVGPIAPWGPWGPVVPVKPLNPWGPVGPAGPIGPVGPWGITKSNITLSFVPLLLTLASELGKPVWVLPTVIVTGPLGPVAPLFKSSNIILWFQTLKSLYILIN